MFLRQFSRVREHQLIQTAIVLPILTLVIQNLDRLLSVTPIIDEQFDRLTLTTQNQETTFDYIIGERIKYTYLQSIKPRKNVLIFKCMIF